MWDLVAAIVQCGGPRRPADDMSYWAKLDRAVMAAFSEVDCRTWPDWLFGNGAMTSRWFLDDGKATPVSDELGAQIAEFIRRYRAENPIGGADAD